MKSEYQEWLDQLKPGDEVAFSQGFERVNRVYRVESRTPSGRIVVDGRTFNPDGTLRGYSKYNRCSDLCKVTTVIRDAARKEVLTATLRAVKWDGVSLADLEAIVAVLRKGAT